MNLGRLLTSITGRARYYARIARIGRPHIDQLESFAYRNIKAKAGNKQWPKAKTYNSSRLPSGLKRVLRQNQTVSFLIVRDQKLWFERYWSDYSPTRNSNSFSAAKSITAMLIGIAQDQGHLQIEQAVADYLPSFATEDKVHITIKDVLCMASGFRFDEDYDSPHSPTALAYYGEDLPELVAQFEMGYPPGARFYYSSGDTQVLSLVLSEATGMSVSDFAEQYLWRKIGAVRDAQWSLDSPGGHEKSYCCFYSNPRDFARIVDLVMQRGRYNGEQVLSEAFIEEMLTPHGIPEEVGGKPSDCYGYQWWLMTYKGYKVYYMRGMQGQYMIALPELDAIVVRLGHNRSEVEINNHSIDFMQILDGVLEMISKS